MCVHGVMETVFQDVSSELLRIRFEHISGKKRMTKLSKSHSLTTRGLSYPKNIHRRDTYISYTKCSLHPDVRID